ncbi:hypothetical protein CYG27_RS03340 [Vibrio parahaemolyticus]|uniref:hypothetical protein n=1 Tax=Vibrio diabolicus TaxID=50719 RepID=UPI001DCB3F74|nr:hypothetical protein [Vibrio diabolicus]EGQ9543716.1 hypothetical protein [Vibrio parahaemolyticus]EGQ9559611.1 hypothetical protein [Vibrio parahaemolyticus]EGQ9605609.1 hypothetical protein [Vibrio parahaemolyticus]EGQ9649797.1 hypothetical protein [Vibrio parahaemolyticus]EGQ9674820.1 hypothetical protein [Vibrio parahaemolyticus]
MRIKHILSIVAITLIPYPSSLLAQESATVGQKSTQEKRTQKETAINDEASMELQRQKGAEQRDGKETRNSTSTSVRDSDETSSRQQNQTTNRLAVKTAPLAILNELFTYIEKGRSTRGRTANVIKHCALVTKPKAPQFPDLEPKPLVTSVQACMAWNKEKTLGQCQVELHQANFNWATTGMPSFIRVPSERLIEDGICWALYGLVAEATLEEASKGIPLNENSTSGIKLALANAMSKQLVRNDLPEKARKIVERQFGQNCVIPTTRGYRYEGKYEWSCGSFSVDPKTISASVGEFTLFGRGNSLFGETWEMETSQSQDALFSVSTTRSNSREASTSEAQYASTDNRSSKSRNLSMRTSERLQTEEASNLSNSTEASFTVSQPGIKGGN